VHVDAEQGGLEAAGLSAAWSAIVRLPPPNLEPFVEALRMLKRPVVLDWGYPTAFLPLVRALHAAGISAWWFDGDRDAARRRFTTRGTVPIEAFEAQMSAIRADWAELSGFYGSRVVSTIKADGSFTDPKEIFKLMFENKSSS
jgi:hypothetical protein